MPTSRQTVPPPQPEQAQAGQAHIAALTASGVLAAWALLDLHALKSTTPAFLAAVHASARRLGSASAAGALQVYRHERIAAGVTESLPRVPMPTPISLPEVEAAITWALGGLYGPVTDEAIKSAQSGAQSAAERLVLNQGRTVTLSAVQADPKARGWARIAEPDACSFCAMLATRGPTYKSEATAAFDAHDNCRCIAQPVFGTWRPSASTKALQQVWQESTAGLSGDAARIAFRQALEGRPRTEKSMPKTAAKSATKNPAALAARLDQALATMRRNNADGSLTAAIAATEKRINALRNAA